MRPGGPRARVQSAIDDLTDEMLGQGFKIRVSGAAAVRDRSHGESIALRRGEEMMERVGTRMHPAAKGSRAR